MNVTATMPVSPTPTLPQRERGQSNRYANFTFRDKFESGAAEKAGGIRDWINDKITDPLVEKTIGRPFARPLWTEMKENAELAAENGRGGDLLTDALRALAGSWGNDFEVHLIGHSAGSIMLGRLLNNLAQKGLTGHVKTVHLYAPACTVAFANRYYAPHKEIMNNLHLDILADQKEQDDNVATIYQKSLLYFREPLKIQSSPKCKARKIFRRAAYGVYVSKEFFRNAAVGMRCEFLVRIPR